MRCSFVFAYVYYIDICQYQVSSILTVEHTHTQKTSEKIENEMHIDFIWNNIKWVRCSCCPMMTTTSTIQTPNKNRMSTTEVTCFEVITIYLLPTGHTFKILFTLFLYMYFVSLAKSCWNPNIANCLSLQSKPANIEQMSFYWLFRIQLFVVFIETFDCLCI